MIINVFFVTSDQWMEVYVQMKLLRPNAMSVFTVNYSKTSPACSPLFPVFVWLR